MMAEIRLTNFLIEGQNKAQSPFDFVFFRSNMMAVVRKCALRLQRN